MIDAIIAEGNIKEEPVEKESESNDEEFAVYHDVVPTKDLEAIPEAKYDDNTPKGADSEPEIEKDKD